jgi:hypothetical protein
LPLSVPTEIGTLPRNITGSLKRPFQRARYDALSKSGCPPGVSTSQRPASRVDVPATAVEKLAPHFCLKIATYSFACPLAMVPEKRSL